MRQDPPCPGGSGHAIITVMKVSLTLSLFSAALIVFLNLTVLDSAKPVGFHVAPTLALRHFTLGFDELLADSLWLRLIQDYDLCEQQRAEEGAPRIGVNRVSDCRKGWVFHMLNVITELAPKFRMPYATGGVALSVLVDDVEGATILINKAVRRFPHDWPILYRASYHFLFELDDKSRAAELMVRAAQNGGPDWLPLLAARLYTKAGKAYLGHSVLSHFEKQYGDNPGLEKLRERLRDLRSKLETLPKSK